LAKLSLSAPYINITAPLMHLISAKLSLSAPSIEKTAPLMYLISSKLSLNAPSIYITATLMHLIKAKPSLYCSFYQQNCYFNPLYNGKTVPSVLLLSAELLH
jgi:hypothetical protein